MPEEALIFERDYIRSTRLEYLRYVPKRYGIDPDQKWPLILFLHGAGERGNDLDILRRHGMPKVAEQLELPFVAISPQCPVDHWWSDFLPALYDLVTLTVSTMQIDLRRIYLTGISMGGYGSWHMAIAYPDLFAAMAPICGGNAWMYGLRERVCQIKHLPTWVFHGAKDDVVPLAASQEMVAALKACDGDVRFTVYPDAKHDSWTETYNNPALYSWFLEHTKKG